MAPVRIIIIRTKDGKILSRERPNLEQAKDYFTSVRLHGLCEDLLYVHPEDIRQIEVKA
jgi:hypothetical protein